MDTKVTLTKLKPQAPKVEEEVKKPHSASKASAKQRVVEEELPKQLPVI
jgi:hypothetical protein